MPALEFDTSLLLKNILARHDFPADEFPKLIALFEERRLRKNEIVFREGSIVKHTFFILKGCLKQYYLSPEGVESIIHFAEENSWIGELNSFLNLVPTKMNLQALEPCEVLSIDKTNWEHAIRTIPDFAIYHSKNRERTVTMLKELLAYAINDTPETKYRRLLNEKPHLLQRLPQYQIAAYLGITPETLSRIRKRNARL